MKGAKLSRIKLEVALSFLATGNIYRNLQYLFRVSKAAISKFFPEVCDSIYLKLGDHMKLRNIRNLFFIHWFMEKLKRNLYWALQNLWIPKNFYTFVKVLIRQDLTSTFYSKRREFIYIWVKLRVWVLSPLSTSETCSDKEIAASPLGCVNVWRSVKS